MLLSGMLVYLAAPPIEAAELKKETAAAFDHYIGASEERIKSELQNGPALLSGSRLSWSTKCQARRDCLGIGA